MVYLLLYECCNNILTDSNKEPKVTTNKSVSYKLPKDNGLKVIDLKIIDEDILWIPFLKVKNFIIRPKDINQVPEYSCVVWSFHYVEHINRSQKSQKRFLWMVGRRLRHAYICPLMILSDQLGLFHLRVNSNSTMSCLSSNLLSTKCIPLTC